MTAKSAIENVEKLHEKLRIISPRDSIPFNSDTEVYYDLHISGSDFDDLLSWISDSFDVDFTEMKGRYAAGEADWIPGLSRLLGRRPYQSVTIGDLIDAIERGRWVGRAPAKSG